MATLKRYYDGQFGEATVVRAAFPDLDEDALNDIAVGLMATGDHLDGEVIPHHAHQRMELADWEREGAASGGRR